MKKLLTIAMITLATMVAKADLYLYWTIDATSASQFDYYAASLVGQTDASTTTALGAMIGGVTELDTATSYSYSNYWVALYDSTMNEIARSEVATYSQIVSSTWNDADFSANPGVAEHTFGGFTATIPEPTSGLMLLLGLAGLALKRKLA